MKIQPFANNVISGISDLISAHQRAIINQNIAVADGGGMLNPTSAALERYC
jgi:hypothetical protein